MSAGWSMVECVEGEVSPGVPAGDDGAGAAVGGDGQFLCFEHEVSSLRAAHENQCIWPGLRGDGDGGLPGPARAFDRRSGRAGAEGGCVQPGSAAHCRAGCGRAIDRGEAGGAIARDPGLRGGGGRDRLDDSLRGNALECERDAGLGVRAAGGGRDRVGVAGAAQAAQPGVAEHHVAGEHAPVVGGVLRGIDRRGWAGGLLLSGVPARGQRRGGFREAFVGGGRHGGWRAAAGGPTVGVVRHGGGGGAVGDGGVGEVCLQRVSRDEDRVCERDRAGIETAGDRRAPGHGVVMPGYAVESYRRIICDRAIRSGVRACRRTCGR